MPKISIYTNQFDRLTESAFFGADEKFRGKLRGAIPKMVHTRYKKKVIMMEEVRGKMSEV